MWKGTEGVKVVYTKGTFHSLEDPRENVEDSRQNIHLQIDIPVGGEYRLHSHILALVCVSEVHQLLNAHQDPGCTLCELPAFVPASATLTHLIMKREKKKTKTKMTKETNKMIGENRRD